MKREQCHFCHEQTGDSASVMIERGRTGHDSTVKICEMSVWCCYDCFYKHLCDSVKERIPEIVSEIRAKVADSVKTV